VLEDRTLLSTSIPLNAAAWTAIGPAPVNSGGGGDTGAATTNSQNLDSGRIAAVAVDPTNANVIYIAAAGGGVAKTTDGGTTWTSLTDDQSTLNMGAIAVAPSNPNVIYAGTGEATLGPSKLAISRDNIYYGRGVLKSTDAGATWTLLTGNPGVNEFDRRTISRIVVDPSDPNTVYVAVGPVATNGLPGNTGVWKSTDGGAHWTDTTAGVSTTAAFSDLRMEPGNDQELFAAVGDPYGNTANGLYETTNGGTSWAPAGNFPSGATDSLVGRILVVISPSSPATMYASVATSGANAVLHEMMKSTDGGMTWAKLTTPNYMGSYGDYNDALAVDPSNPGVVYAAGQAGTNSIIESTNGGGSWTDISLDVNRNGPHPDHHDMVFDASGLLLDANDGGLWRLQNPNPSNLLWNDLNGNLNTLQMEGFTQDPTSANTAYAGLQDNGTDKFTDNFVWNEIDGGDGGKVLDSFSSPMVVFHDAAVASFGASAFVERSTDGGKTFSPITTGIHASTEPTIFYPPFVMDPSNATRLLIGTSRVYETTSSGNSWTPLSTPGQNGWTATTAINGLAVAPSDVNTIYASAGGHVFVTANHGATWTQTDPVASPPAGLQFRGMIVDPADAQHAFVVARAFGDQTGGGHVWMTTNAGGTWTDISSNLPDLPCWTIQFEPQGAGMPGPVLFVGTDVGVYFSTNQGGSWSRMGLGLPNAAVITLDLRTNLGILGAGTNGRGAWEIELAHFRVTASASSVTAGSPFSITVTALDRSGMPVTNFTGTVHFTAADPNAMLPADYTFTAADMGVHTFNGVVLGKAGHRLIQVTDSVETGAEGQLRIDVAPGAATHFRVKAPKTTSPGAPFSVTVTALDAFGNTATGFLDTVHFRSSDPAATLPMNYTFTSGDAGVHTFSGVALQTVGRQRITVTDTTNHAIKGAAHVTVIGAGADFGLAPPGECPIFPDLQGPSLTDWDAFFIRDHPRRRSG
jgi:hypothetical protein